MLQLQTPTERQYRTTVNHLAIALLVFYGLFNLYVLAMSYLVPSLADRLGTPFDTVLYEGANGVLYAVAFLVPMAVFGILHRHSTPRVSADLSLTLPPETPLYIFAVLALVSAAGYVNSWLLEVFEYRTFTDEMLFEMGAKTNVELVLTLFTLCIVPAFVEEILFRGVILKHLSPYGRTTAVLASALLFGLMHQNAGQFFYATVAGLALGYVLLKTKSLWCCILIHFCNNFLSLFSSALGERLTGQESTVLLFALEVAVFVFGIVAAVALMLRAKRTPETEAEDEAVLPLSRRLRLFFSIPMVIFFALCAAQMAMLLILSLLI